MHPTGFLSFLWIEFSYELDDVRHYITVKEPNESGEQTVILAGFEDYEGFLVRCELERTRVMSDFAHPYLDILVKPQWAPRGGSRFLELVRERYYDGVAIHRVVPNFVAQFGIAKRYRQRTKWSSNFLLDDDPIPDFQWGPCQVSFAGERI